MNQSFPLVFYALFLSSVAAVYSELPITYFDDEAGNECKALKLKNEVGDSGILISHRNYGKESYRPGLNCIMNIFAPCGFRIRLRILEFDVDEAQQQCQKDTFFIFDRDEESHPEELQKHITKSARLISQHCGTMQNKTEQIKASKNVLSLWWVTHEGPDARGGKGFKMLWTVFRDLPKGKKCNDKEFACECQECISASLACNGYQNCPDGSDEDRRTCGGDGDWVSGWTLLLACFLVFCAVVICGICSCKICRYFKPAEKELFDTAEKKPCCIVEASKQPLPPSFFPPQPPRLLVPSVASSRPLSIERYYPINHCNLRPSTDRHWPSYKYSTPADSGYGKYNTRLSSDSDYAYVRNDFRRLIP